jgi:predicted RNA methylase
MIYLLSNRLKMFLLAIPTLEQCSQHDAVKIKAIEQNPLTRRLMKININCKHDLCYYVIFRLC